MIKVIKLNKTFDGKCVLRDFDITFPNEGFIALCGPSGCGKTTLLNLISGLVKGDSGEIVFDSPNPKISMSFQEARLLPERNAVQNVNIVLGDKKATIDQSRSILEQLGISDPSAYPEELSGGMKARVGIARALAVKADIYLFDEPFANLDEETARLVFNVIKKHTHGKLCLTVMHDRQLAFQLADSVIDFGEAPIIGYSTAK